MQYWDLTLHELTAMIAGYNVRWEEQWRHTRALYTLLYNINSKKPKKATEIMPLPSESEIIAWQKYIDGLKATMSLTEGTKRGGRNGSGINSKI
jgi:hypothetical protein